MRGPTILLLIAALVAAPAHAGMFDKTKDPTDGKFDISAMLMSGKGFMAVPIIVTEPAIGFGLGAAVGFFHGKPQGDIDVWDESIALEDIPPPTVSGAAAMYTTNDSWFAAGFHSGHYKRDKLRNTSALGLAKLNLTFYEGDTPLEFKIDGMFLFEEFKARLGGSDWFLGGRYMYLDTKNSFRDDPGDVIPDGQLDSANAALSFVGYYDSRDTIFTPSKGQEASMVISRYDKRLGGDFDYNQFDLRVTSNHQVHEKWNLGVFFSGQFTAGGEPPFYGLPYIKLRGVPVLRYQGGKAVSTELEARWNVVGRWSVLGFAGAGRAWGSDILPEYTGIYAGGVGGRYLIARRMGMQVGIDVAQGPEQTVFYLVIGSGWPR